MTETWYVGPCGWAHPNGICTGHAAATAVPDLAETSLRRIADALERIADAIEHEDEGASRARALSEWAQGSGRHPDD